MKNSNSEWKIILVSILILIFSLSFRFDFNNYPRGIDTYDLSALSNNVLEKEYVVWNIDIPTALGFTSFSYPSGGIIFLAEISSITGMNISDVIFTWNLFLITMCGLLIFVITKEIFHNNMVSIFSTLIYLNTRFFITYSTFFTARNLLHVFFLLTLFLLLKKLDLKKILLIGIIIGISFLTHRATILIGIFIITFILSRLLYKIYKNNLSHNILLVILSISIFLLSIYFFGHTNFGSETTIIPFHTGFSYIDDILSILFSISMHFGILLIIFPLGYFLLIRKKQKNKKDFFILISATLASGFIVDTVYFFYIFLPLITIIIAYFFEYLFESNIAHIKKIASFIVIILLILPNYITISKPQSDSTFVRDQTIQLKSFLENQQIQKSVICNYHVVYCSQILTLGNNITALTYTSGKTLIEEIKIKENKIFVGGLRTKIIVEDDVLGAALFSDSYTLAIINWNNKGPILERLIEFTNLGYIIDSNNPESIKNTPKLQQKFGNINQIYDNGL